MIDYMHLYYFWVVTRQDGITRASECLHLRPQTISGQIGLLEDSVGEALFSKAGRNLELTETGRLAPGFADEIFSLGGELEEALHNRPPDRQMTFKVGTADVVPKTIAYRLLLPHLPCPTRYASSAARTTWPNWPCSVWTWLSQTDRSRPALRCAATAM